MCLVIPGRIVGISPDQPNRAVVEVVGVRREVDLALLQHNPPVTGEWVLIHAGLAMNKISEDDVLDRMRTLRMLGEPVAFEQEVKGLEEQS